MNCLLAEAAAPSGELFPPDTAVYEADAPIRPSGLAGPVTLRIAAGSVLAFQLRFGSGQPAATPDLAIDPASRPPGSGRDVDGMSLHPMTGKRRSVPSLRDQAGSRWCMRISHSEVEWTT